MSKLDDLEKDLDEFKKATDLAVLQEIINNLQSTKATADEAVRTANEAKTEASGLLSSTQEAKKTFDGLVEQVDAVAKKAEESDKLIAESLGIANASELSANFSVQAGRLKTSSDLWWRSTQTWVVLLTLSIVGVIAWETVITHDFTAHNSVGFIVKLAVASPFAFLAYSASKQHRIETNLRHQYDFKAAVASALEAYSQLLSRNIRDEDDEGKKALNLFLQERIAAIFREPTENFVLVEGDDGHESWILGFTGRAYGVLQKLVSKALPNK